MVSSATATPFSFHLAHFIFMYNIFTIPILFLIFYIIMYIHGDMGVM
jgi:hypothetical protein